MTRRILGCTNCQRQYDVSKREVGAKVRCHCGTVLEIKAAKSHESSVVRCSSCGAARENNLNRCGFCHADFTLHERDLNTICPECLTRISSKAKYCHHCATPIVPESLSDDGTTKLRCPACDDRHDLKSRQLGHEQFSVAECDSCGGLWIGFDTFKRLREQMVRKSIDLEESSLLGSPRRDLEAGNSRRYRNCSVCDSLMTRRQYSRGSGVIIDSCRKHGIWFDCGELNQTLAWIASGGRIENPLAEETNKATRSPATSRDTTAPPQSDHLAGIDPAKRPPIRSTPSQVQPASFRIKSTTSSDPFGALFTELASCLDSIFG